LCRTNRTGIDYRGAYLVAELTECPSSYFDDTGPIVSNPGHVLDEDMFGADNFNKPDHAEVKLVLGVDSPSVVVQVTVSLARRPSHGQRESLKARTELALAPGWTIAELSVEQFKDVAVMNISFVKVVAVDLQGGFVVVQSQDMHGSLTHRASSLRCSNGKSPAAAEQVCDGYSLRRRRVLGGSPKPGIVKLVHKWLCHAHRVGHPSLTGACDPTTTKPDRPLDL